MSGFFCFFFFFLKSSDDPSPVIGFPDGRLFFFQMLFFLYADDIRPPLSLSGCDRKRFFWAPPKPLFFPLQDFPPWLRGAFFFSKASPRPLPPFFFFFFFPAFLRQQIPPRCYVSISTRSGTPIWNRPLRGNWRRLSIAPFPPTGFSPFFPLSIFKSRLLLPPHKLNSLFWRKWWFFPVFLFFFNHS